MADMFLPRRFSDAHKFDKPNDVRALRLMDRAAKAVLEEFGDVVLAFGESDEYRSASQPSSVSKQRDDQADT